MDGAGDRGSRRRISLRDVAALQPGTIIWDTAVVGFGIRRQRGPEVRYILVYRTADGRQRLITLGRHGSPWTPETARQESVRLLGDVSRGGDPMADRRSRRGSSNVTIAAFC